MRVALILSGFLAVTIATACPVSAQVGRYQVVSVGTPAVAVLVDTVLGCTWHLASLPGSGRLWFTFIPRQAVPPGSDKTTALIPKECAGFDGFELSDPQRPDVPERRP